MDKNFNEVQKMLIDGEVPEFISFVPNELLSTDLRERVRVLSSSNLGEISQNNELIGCLTDFFSVPQETNLSQIEKLLGKCKPVSGSFFGEKSVDALPDDPRGCTNEFKPVYTKPAGESKKECNVDEYILERISKEILETGLDISWEDIVGLEDVKKAINEIVLWPMMRPDIFTGLRGPPKGLLLFGPPGTGKTMIGKCIASQCKATFFSISASSLTSKWMGEGEKMVRALFYLARKMSPSVIFVDEIDSLLSQRSDNENEGSRRIKTEFLVQFDGAGVDDKDRILVIGATNRPQEIDEAARRRLVKRIYVALPEFSSRRQMVQQLLRGYPNSIADEELDEIARITDGYSGSDMFNLCREATLEPLREIKDINSFKPEDTRDIRVQDFQNSMRQIRKSVSTKDLAGYSEWNELFGSMQCQIK